MMKAKTYIPLVVGLVVGVLAIKLTFDYVRKARADTMSGQGAPVVRARATIPMAAEITNDMVEVVQVPKAFVPKDAFSKKEDVVGRVTSVIVTKDLPITANLLAPKGTTPGMEARIPRGYRAVAVKIDESSGVAFLVKPGSRVDVVAVMTSQGGRDSETVSKTILENIEVAAVGQELGNNTDKASVTTKSVTLLLKPEDVPTLHLAAQKGKILLAMRNQVDMSSRQLAGTTEKKLLGREDTKAESAKPGLFSRLLSRDQAASARPHPETRPVVVSAARNPRDWSVEVIASSRKDKTEVEQVRFDGPDAVQRSGPAGLTGAGRAPAFARQQGGDAGASEPPARKSPTTVPPDAASLE
ncbi:MAG: Flp pilus assembly protein CpaB [Phycisphaerae bacterium]